MQQICAALQNDSSDAAKLCDWMISNGYRAASEIDTGVTTIDFVSQSAHTQIIENTRNNGVLEAQEVFSSVIELLENEEEDAVAASSFSVNSFPRADFVSYNTSFNVPWLLSGDPVLMGQVASKISYFKSELLQQHLFPQTREYNLALAERLADYITDPEGLDVRHTFIASQEWTALETLTQSHAADCSEFSMLYYELTRLAGLDSNIVNVVKNSLGVREYHFMVALHLDPANSNDVTFVDLTKANRFFNPPPQEWVSPPLLSTLAYYHMNLGLMPPESIVSQGDDARFSFAENEYQTALGYDPDLPLLHYNMGKLYRYYGQPDLALQYFTRALELDPDDAQTASELSSLILIQSQ